MLNANYLHKQVREKGGAYGSGASHGKQTFSLHSYWDPESTQTLNAFQTGLDWLIQGQFTQDHIEAGLLSTFSSIDAPSSPRQRGIGSLVCGVDELILQQHRTKLLNQSHVQLQEVAVKYLDMAAQRGFLQGDQEGVVAGIAGSELSAKDFAHFQHFRS